MDVYFTYKIESKYILKNMNYVVGEQYLTKVKLKNLVVDKSSI